ncbi:MAG: carbohydrate ABC transporter permease [Bacillota bacterium]
MLAHRTQANDAARRRRYLKETFTAYLYLLPATAVLVVFHFAPVFYAFYVSLLDWNYISPNPAFVGIANYAALLQDSDFVTSLLNTVYYVVGTVPTSMAAALLVAILLNQKIRGLAWYRTVYFLPVITAANAVAIIWFWIYHPDYSGLLNGFLDKLGLPIQSWLLDPRWAMPCIILMSIWKGLGYNVVIFLAGLQNISTEYYEAAQIDGARGWSIFRHITWPLLSPTTFFVLIISVIGSFQVFSQVYVMTRGGPLKSTLVVVYYLYKIGFEDFKMGYASAMAYALFVIIFVLTLLQRKYIGSRVHYQ